MSIDWKSPTGGKHSADAIAVFETQHGIALPDEIKAAHAVGWDAVAWRNGQECIATRPVNGVESTNFHGLMPLMSADAIAAFRAEHSARLGVDLSQTVPFGSNGELYVCLKYGDQSDGPEVWTIYMDEDLPEDAFYKVADDVPTFLDALVAADQLENA